MCGILGYTHKNRPLPEGVLKAGIAALVHRGPDQQGSFTSPHISLGATRLRIIDLQGGDQPMRSTDGDAVIAFNGEIYNHRELRSELESCGIEFRSHSDTEVALNAFLVWGPAGIARLRGMFGAAIWIESEQRLLLARDRVGIKPLYYCVHNGELSFGSELKAIFANPEIPRRIDLTGLNCYLSLNYVPGPYTLVEGIQKLMPGCLLNWQNGRYTIASYVTQPSQRRSPSSLGEACEELDDLLTQSVREQLVSDVPLGMWLSGGLDSSTVLHYATRQLKKRLKTFSVTFHGKSFDESSYIQQVANAYGTDHTEFDLNESADLGDVIGELAYYSDEPSADAGAVPVWYLSRMTRKDVTVALSGEGADELFGGYLMYKADRYNRYFSMLPRLLRRGALRLAQHIPPSDEKIGLDYKIKRFLQGSLLSPKAAHVFWNGTFTEDEKRQLFRYANSGPLAGILSEMQPANFRGSFLERFLDFDQRYSMPDAILYKVDRMSMAHSVEVRPPFLDHRIVAFASRLPQSYKLSGFESKFVLRRLMKNALPAPVLQRPKIGFDIPIHEWFRGMLRRLLMETLNERTVTDGGLFNWPEVRRLIDEHLDRKANWGYHLWGLVTLTLWMKRWKIEAPTLEPLVFAAQAQSVHPIEEQAVQQEEVPASTSESQQQ